MEKYLKTNRTLLSIYLSIFFVIAAGLFIKKFINLPVPDTDELPDWFWVQKVVGGNDADLVIIGDSRVYRDLATKVIEKEIGDIKAINLGFSSGGLNREIYNLASLRLNQESLKPVILLAVSPYSLTDESAKNLHYKETLNTSKQFAPWEKSKIYHDIISYIKPIKFTDLKYIYSKSENPEFRYIQKPESGGWAASMRIPVNENLAYEEYFSFFKSNKISQELIDDLFKQIKIWKQQKICVFATRLPISEKLRKMEDMLSGYNQKDFIDKFSKAGGIWLEIPEGDSYITYDGSHLDEYNARKLSAELALKIKKSACNNRI